MPNSIEEMLRCYRIYIENIFGDIPIEIILYGSYARGDFGSDSDVDIMILAVIEPEDIVEFRDKVYDISYDFKMQFNVEINPVIQSFATFEYWKEVYPFFVNIEREGITI